MSFMKYINFVRCIGKIAKPYFMGPIALKGAIHVTLSKNYNSFWSPFDSFTDRNF